LSLLKAFGVALHLYAQFTIMIITNAWIPA